MGSSFFKGPKISGTSQNMEARAIGSSVYGARGAGAGALRSLSEAKKAGKNGAKPLKRSAAYAKGSKV